MKNINIKYVFRFIVSITLVVYLTKQIDLSLIRNFSWKLLSYIFLSTVLLSIFTGFMAYRWKVLLSFFVRERVKFIDLYKFYFIGLLFNIFLPGAIGGDITRINNSNKKYGLGIKTAALIAFIERVAGITGLAVIFSVGIIIYSDSYIKAFNSYLPEYILIGVIFLVIVSKKNLEKKIHITYLTMIQILLFSILGQSVDIIIAYLFSQYYNLPLQIYHFLVVIPLVYIATVLPISLGGIGVREGAMVALLSIMGVKTSIAAVIAFLMYLSKVGVGIIGLSIYLRSK